MSSKFHATDIINTTFYNIITPIYEIISIITIIFTIIVIFIIITKTPKAMKSFKTYLLPYTINHLMVEISMFIMCPAMLHPFVYVYPLGVARYLPANWFLLVMGLSGYFASSIFDCIVAMNLERYYAMKSLDSYLSKVPSVVFWCLHSTSIGVMGFVVVVAMYKPFYADFVVPEEDVKKFVEGQVQDLDKIIDITKLIVFYSSDTLIIPLIPLIWVVSGTLRVNIALITFIINARISRILPTMQNHNRLLLRLVYIQFFGIAGILFSSVIIAMITYIFVKTPSCIVAYCFGIMNFFCLYDTAVTVLFIKPYRKSFVSIFKLLFCMKKVHVFQSWTTMN